MRVWPCCGSKSLCMMPVCLSLNYRVSGWVTIMMETQVDKHMGD